MKSILNAPLATPSGRLEWALNQLRTCHVRITPVRERVLIHLSRRTAPATLNDISSAPELTGQFDDATVYRTLVLLVELEVARQLQFRDRATCFVLNVPGECFSFLVCRCCGEINPIAHASALRAIEEEIALKQGYTGLTHQLEIYGLCPRCQQHTHACAKPSKFLPGLRLRGRPNN